LLTNALWALNRHSGTVDLMFVMYRKLSRMLSEMDAKERQRSIGDMDLNEFNTVHKVRHSHYTLTLFVASSQ